LKTELIKIVSTEEMNEPKRRIGDEPHFIRLRGFAKEGAAGVGDVIKRACDLAELPAAEVEGVDRAAKHRYSGFLVRDILGLVGAPMGESLRGQALALTVRITGLDNYSVVFALAEFDPDFNDRSIILAYQQDGQALPDDAAPFRIVIPGDGHLARWVRQVKSIEIMPVGQ
jgi:DMSO/TMAO reductase YedYZ molybdopterin-dependent catalytic subunit